MCNGTSLWWCFLMLMSCGVLTEVRSLRCYECTESELNSCGEHFDKNNVTALDCRMSIYTIDTAPNEDKVYTCLFIKETEVGNGKSMFTRRCGLKNQNDTCESITLRNQAIIPRIRTTCAQCENDLCNSSTLLLTPFNGILLLVYFAVFKI